jgi:predicted signal transduction protein with EAL and GGDEF domain
MPSYLLRARVWGQSLGLSEIAVSFEAHEQLGIPKLLGCSEFQGYFFGLPRPAEAKSSLLLGGVKVCGTVDSSAKRQGTS